MSTFFRKVASAFVVMENAPAGQPTDDSSAQQGLDDITKETSQLLAQLETRNPEASDGGTSAGADTPDALMALTAEDVFREQGVGDSSTSALRLLKLIAGLSMFPREQQLAMVRAMDSADESWSEPEVVADARKRQGLLRAHLNRVAQARAQRMSALAQEIDDAKKNGDAVLAELDRRIADLYARRESEATATTTNVGKLVQKQKELEASESRSRQGVAQVIQALAGLLTFLGVPPGPEGS